MPYDRTPRPNSCIHCSVVVETIKDWFKNDTEMEIHHCFLLKDKSIPYCVYTDTGAKQRCKNYEVKDAN